MSSQRACIELAGKQFIVGEGDLIKVPSFSLKKFTSDNNGVYKTDKVLAILTDNSIKVGTPYIQSAQALFKVEKTVKGKKVVVFKFKKRKGYHKKIGHRQQYHIIKVVGVQI